MLTHLSLQSFKAFESAELPLAPITLLLGPNNSGKSSLLAPVRLLTQTLESLDPDVPLLLSGVLGDFGTYKDLVYKNHRGRPMAISLATAPSEHWDRSRRPRFQRIKVDLTYKFRTQRRELLLRDFALQVNGTRHLRTEYSLDSERHLLAAIGHTSVPATLKSTLSRTLRMNHFLPTLYQPFREPRESREPTQAEEFLTDQLRSVIRRANLACREFEHTVRSVDYLGAMRNPPSRTYQFTGERRQRVGLHGQNAPGLLALDAARRGKRKASLVRSVSGWLNAAGIASSVAVEALSDRHYELRLSHPETGEEQNIADVGYGNSQVIPVLVGGFSRQPGDTFLVEEPEIHLHPRAQALLGDFVAQLYANGVQTIFETHSEHLILRLLQHVAAENVHADDVHLYHVCANGRSERKEVRRVRIDQQGRFEPEWPDGFFPERLNEAKRLAMVREKQLDLNLPYGE